MPAGTYHIVCEQGATFSRTLEWKDETQALVNLTGYTARMSVKDSIGGTEQISLTTENGRITLGGAAGTITLTIADDITAGLTPGCYLYDLELESSSGDVTRLVEGRFLVKAEVTT